MTHLVNVMEHQQMFFLYRGYLAINTREPDSDREIRAFHLGAGEEELVSSYISFERPEEALDTDRVKQQLIEKYDDLRDADSVPDEGLEILETFAKTGLLPGEKVKRISDGKMFVFLRAAGNDKDSFVVLIEGTETVAVIEKSDLSWKAEIPNLPDEADYFELLKKFLENRTVLRLKKEICGVSTRYHEGAKFTIKEIKEDKRTVIGYFGYSSETVHFKNMQIPTETGDTI